MKKNKSKVVDRVLNILAIVVSILVIIIAISTITSSEKGYNEMFGVASVTVLTNSMEGKAEDSFNKGDLIYIKILKDAEKSLLEKDDVITFYDYIDGKVALNTHRVIEKMEIQGEMHYRTKGDNADYADGNSIKASEVVGKYNGSRIRGVGSIITFIKSPVGFGVLVLAPCFLVVLYAIIRVIMNLKKVNQEKLELAVQGAKAELSEQDKEALKAEYMASLGNKPQGNPNTNTTKKE